MEEARRFESGGQNAMGELMQIGIGVNSVFRDTLGTKIQPNGNCGNEYCNNEGDRSTVEDWRERNARI